MWFKTKSGKRKKAQQDKMIDLFMIQGARHSFFAKKLAKVNMPNTFSRLGNEGKVKNIVFKMDNCYDIQWREEDNKVTIMVTFKRNYALEW